MAQYDDLPTRRIAVISVIAVAVTVVTILAVQVLYYGMLGYVMEDKLEASRYSDSNEHLARQSRSISQFSVDENDGSYVIPIEQAMRKIAREASANHDNQPAPADAT